MKNLFTNLLEYFGIQKTTLRQPVAAGCSDEKRELAAISKLNFRLIDIDQVFAN